MRASKGLLLTAVVVFGLAFVPGVAGQANGVPASVTSIGFGGNFNTHPGVPASVTSIGPHGIGGPVLFSQSSFNQSHKHHLFPHHHHQDFFPGGIPVVAVPYAYPYPVEVPVAVSDDEQADEYNGGPTIFDRRGPGPSNRQDEQRYNSGRDDQDRYVSRREETEQSSEAKASQGEEPAANQPDTHIVFKDGHSVDVSNYAIIGTTVYDLTPGHSRKIALSDIDVPATQKQNEDRGVDFNVPAS